MKKSFLKNNFILLTYIFTFLISILNFTQIPINADTISTDILLQESDERSVDTIWIYKTVNGKNINVFTIQKLIVGLQTGFQSDANRVCRTKSVRQPLPFCHTLSFIYTYSYIPHVPRSVRRTLP